MEVLRTTMSWLEPLRVVPKAALRLAFVLLNNAYCVPTYVIWMCLLSPLRRINPDAYWRIEGLFFHWLLAMVSMWSWSAGYDILEMGDSIAPCLEDRTLVIANHQSTADVPLLMACFNAKRNVLPNLMWIMDSLFKYTNFGIVSILHQDFFIVPGKDNRNKSLEMLKKHLQESFVPRNRNWMVLFPEGGFLRKRRSVSQRFALKNNLPVLQHVTLPRLGAMQAIIDVLGPPDTNQTTEVKNNNADRKEPEEQQSLNIKSLNWVLDITIAYPEGKPLDMPTIVLGYRPPCKTVLFYRLYRCEQVPRDADKMAQWLYARFEEKERILETFYKTGKIPASQFVTSGSTPQPAQEVQQDCLRYIILHLFFITSTYIHYQMLYAVYHYYTSLVY